MFKSSKISNFFKKNFNNWIFDILKMFYTLFLSIDKNIKMVYHILYGKKKNLHPDSRDYQFIVRSYTNGRCTTWSDFRH